MCGMVRRAQRKIAVDADTLAYDVIASVGPGGNFLTEDHTYERCRSEFWLPDVSDRNGLHAWMSSGRENAEIRAQRRWQGCWPSMRIRRWMISRFGSCRRMWM